MLKLLFFFALLTLINQNSIAGLPHHKPNTDGTESGAKKSDHNDKSQKLNIVGDATNVIATQILKAYSETDKNFVFSPLGFSSILAILNEGAKGETALDITKLLNHQYAEMADDNKEMIRQSYRTTLKSLQGDNPIVAPQFKTWMYIYRNNTVLDEFKTNIRDNYYVEVKDIDRIDYGDLADKPSTSAASATATATKDDEDDDEKPIGEEPLLLDEKVNVVVEIENVPIIETNENSKDIPDFETLKKTNPAVRPDDEIRLYVEGQKDASKFDAVVEDKQYVEVPVIKDEIAANKAAAAAAAAVAIEGNTTASVNSATKSKDASEPALTDMKTQLVEKTKEEIKKDKINIKEEMTKIKEETKPSNEAEDSKMTNLNSENLEIMEAQESRFARQFGSKNEVTSIISGNSLVAPKNEAERDVNESKMILFNGLYYRGSWAIPFQQLRSESSENVFYTSETEKISTKMMKARGLYRVGTIEELKAQAIELPYDNERYALLILLPNSRNGLKYLMDEFTIDTLPHIIDHHMEDETIEISLPKFNIDTTSGAEKILSKSGLAQMFTKNADFSGISTDLPELHVDELQQHVSVRVDEGSSSENFLTAANALRSNGKGQETSSSSSIIVDRPFLFFVRDIIDNVIIVAGKMMKPSSLSSSSDDFNF